MWLAAFATALCAFSACARAPEEVDWRSARKYSDTIGRLTIEIGGGKQLRVAYSGSAMLFAGSMDDPKGDMPLKAIYGEYSGEVGRAKEAGCHISNIEDGAETVVSIGGRGSRMIIAGEYGNVLYEIDGTKQASGWRGQFSLTSRDTLATAVVPRIELRQKVNGRWMRLSRFATGLEWWRLAPADSMEIGVVVEGMLAVWLRDRVMLRCLTEEERRGVRGVLRRPGFGSWDKGADELLGDIDGLGETRDCTLPIWPPRSSIEFDVELWRNDHRAKANGNDDAHLTIRYLVYWPEVGRRDSAEHMIDHRAALPCGARDGAEDSLEEFPGGGVYPAWAASFLKGFHRGYAWRPEPGTSNYRIYGPCEDALHAELLLYRELVKKREFARAREYWTRIIDFAGSDTVSALKRISP